MIKRIKEYFEYKRNLKKVKREIVKLGSTTLPLANLITSNALDLVNFATKVINECGNLEGDKLLDRLQSIIKDSISVFANKFETDEERLFEIVKYIATLDKSDIQKIITDAQVETLLKDNDSWQLLSKI